ncbi:hypothetical protein BJ322DRAFT_142498 [Thelephora terrestris]|uniref:F-box domain-containing protein n=1 Tax=Thelephora terrestris TaxID=56493 RepID=A0A9P6L5N0_9AGAM|nr:hypothetical protein BJ322DRAFT_142498 [Thelephora terrestris]
MLRLPRSESGLNCTTMSGTTCDRSLLRSPTSSLSGVELLANVVWHRSKAKLTGVLAKKQSAALSDAPQPRTFPPELAEMVIAHLKYDTLALKACASTCFCWYNISIPHLHRTLILGGRFSKKFQRSNPLPSLYKLGLLPFVEQLQLAGTMTWDGWVVPALSDSRNMPYIRAMVNLQELDIEGLNFFKFPAGFGGYLGHFAPTLRSVALTLPNGARRQLLDFFRLFPNLDNIEVLHYDPVREVCDALDTQLAPINGGLRGRLTLNTFGEIGLFEDLVVAFGGMRFTSMDLSRTLGKQLLLCACADTLETLRLDSEDLWAEDLYPEDCLMHPLVQEPDLSPSTALRSIEVPAYSLTYVKKALSTITSPVFHEIVVIFSEREVDRQSENLAGKIRELYGIREFSVAFCLEVLGTSPGAEGQHKLALNTNEAVAAGLYDFLPRPPLVFSRMAPNHVRRCSIV